MSEGDSLFWRLAAPRDLRRSFREVRHGHRYVPLGLRSVATVDLRVRWEPLLIPKQAADLSDVYQCPHWRAENPIDRFFPLVNGFRDRRLRHTPHSDVLRAYDDTGVAPEESDYVRLMRVRARLQGRTRSEEFLQEKVRRLIAVFNSIRTRGYRAGLAWRQPITVFEKPLAPPSSTYEPRNWEVFDGHHRAAALSVLGAEKVQVLVLRSVEVEPYSWDMDIPWREEWWARLAGPQAEPFDLMEHAG